MTVEQAKGSFGPAWELLSVTPETDLKLPFFLGDARPSWYRLRRSS
jgi:hypothetical protein